MPNRDAEQLTHMFLPELMAAAQVRLCESRLRDLLACTRHAPVHECDLTHSEYCDYTPQCGAIRTLFLYAAVGYILRTQCDYQEPNFQHLRLELEQRWSITIKPALHHDAIELARHHKEKWTQGYGFIQTRLASQISRAFDASARTRTR